MTDQYLISLKELAEETGISINTLTNYLEKKKIKYKKGKKFDRDEVIIDLYEKGSAKIRGKLKDFVEYETQEDIEQQNTFENNEIDFNTITVQRASDLKIKLQAEQMYIETNERKLESVSLSDVVIPLFVRIAARIKKDLMNFGHNINDKIEGKNYDDRAVLIEEEINKILNNLSVDIKNRCIEMQKATKKRKYYKK